MVAGLTAPHVPALCDALTEGRSKCIAGYSAGPSQPGDLQVCGPPGEHAVLRCAALCCAALCCAALSPSLLWCAAWNHAAALQQGPPYITHSLPFLAPDLPPCLHCRPHHSTAPVRLGGCVPRAQAIMASWSQSWS